MESTRYRDGWWISRNRIKILKISPCLFSLFLLTKPRSCSTKIAYKKISRRGCSIRPRLSSMFDVSDGPRTCSSTDRPSSESGERLLETAHFLSHDSPRRTSRHDTRCDFVALNQCERHSKLINARETRQYLRSYRLSYPRGITIQLWSRRTHLRFVCPRV